ncbi:alpha/beta hydrolase [Fulvivirga sp. RKSG066]|uniref:alpha/beta hydrolase n=1 Tax=Fulvivirga aurantia TaxID=2529383 RepID=UPI0012BCD787|nr:alpha/beta hydrolase [Fulvivirga aurantia]MTI20557.1 alpha/beta hydrolase [Fulvivirga aurantia]
MKIYGIGGLGVDQRIFSELSLDFDLIPLEWIPPIGNEKIEVYATRFAKQINAQEPFGIIGVSFGGMIAIELNKILSPKLIILISSATSKNDIPWTFRVLGKIGIFKKVPNFLIKPPPFLANYLFGISHPKHKKTLRQIIADTDTGFLRWAINQIAIWNNVNKPSNLIRIHGSSDRMLTFAEKDKVIAIPNGGHFMVVDKADELSRILNQILHESTIK